MRHLERGSTMVEFAIAALAFLLLLFGVLQFGQALYTYHTVSDAARLGSRWAIVRGAQCSGLDHCNAQSSDVQTYVRAQSPLINANGMTVAATWPGNNSTCKSGGAANAPGCLVSVTVSYTYTFSLPFISGAGLPLSSTSQMIISQ